MLNHTGQFSSQTLDDRAQNLRYVIRGSRKVQEISNDR